ncbi:UNVERIFIED_CONTAM: Retrovirus-related Pol polyprotein from transposon TNT 1-94 [Sesamum angustifolium]|uniref:Retrovirus-related Pol polyprotein from transposon TNT 1-94 n=1 Tax=Sesamum angustifolium TaxID=2727405 RepID=A0AAW2JP85_9LAMI
MGKGKKMMGTQQQSRANDICAYCREKGHWKRDPNLSSDQGMFVVEVNMVTNSASWVMDTGCGAHICNELQVLQSCRKLSEDEVVLRLGDGKAVTTEAVGIINLVVSDHVRLELKDCYFVPNMIKNIISILLLDNPGFEFLINKNCFYLMKDRSSHLLGHISQDRMKRWVDSKSLEVDNLDNLPVCESCLKAKMTKKPFVGQSKLANGLSNLIHIDVRGPLNTQARGVGSPTSKHFSMIIHDYLKENGIVSQWTPPGTPQLNGVAERRNRILLDMIRSMMSFTELPLSFWGYALETAAKLLNIAPSKTVAQTPYQIWHGKPASYNYLRVWGSPAYVKRLVGDKLDLRSSLCRFIRYPKETAGYYLYDPSEHKVFVSRNAVFLEIGFPTDTRCDELLLEESSEAPQSNAGTSYTPNVSTDNVPILRRSARVPQPPERYGFLGVTGQLDNDPKTYGEAMSDIESRKWLEAMKSEMDSMSSNQARLVAKGYTQRPGIDFEETFSPVAMAKSIRIMLAITAWYDYEIWQMDVKTAFLNDFVEEEIYMDQPEGFTVVGEEQKVCHLQRSIYGLKHAFRSWNIHFDEVIRGYDFVKNDFDPCVYKKVSGSSVLFLVLYMDEILLIGNYIKMLGDTKAWLCTQFSMKDLGEASYILGIKIFRDRSKRILGMTQNSYVDNVLKIFKMEHSKRGFLPMRNGVKLSKKQSPKTDEELKRMLDIHYALAVGSIQYQACAGEAHWTAVKTILKYLRRTKDVFLVYGGGELILEGFSDASFQSDDDDAKSQSGFVFKLNGGVVAWKSSKQDTTADSTTEAEYIAASEAAKEAVWIKKLHPRVGCVT